MPDEQRAARDDLNRWPTGVAEARQVGTGLQLPIAPMSRRRRLAIGYDVRLPREGALAPDDFHAKENRAMPYATNDGVRIRYEVAGSGPTLLLHIGFVGGLEDWNDAGYVAPLVESYRLVLLDPRGQGRSDKPHDLVAYTLRNRVDDIVAVLDAEAIDRAHVWGYSMGGRIGFALGAFAPDRLASLIVGGADPFPGNPRPIEGDFFWEGMHDGMAPFVAACEAADPTFFVSPGERARWLAADSNALRAACLTGVTEPDIEQNAVAAIRVPTLIYAGTRDEPEPKERAAYLMPNAAFVALDGLDHAAAFGRSDLVLPHALAFLAGLGANAPGTS